MVEEGDRESERGRGEGGGRGEEGRKEERNEGGEDGRGTLWFSTKRRFGWSKATKQLSSINYLFKKSVSKTLNICFHGPAPLWLVQGGETANSIASRVPYLSSRALVQVKAALGQNQKPFGFWHRNGAGCVVPPAPPLPPLPTAAAAASALFRASSEPLQEMCRRRPIEP